MLKIKDNVDLKELEKYGFKKTEYGLYYYKLPHYRSCEFSYDEIVEVYITFNEKKRMGM